MPNSPLVRTALVGCGNIGVKGHIPAYAGNPNAAITAVCDSDAAMAATAGAATGAKVYLDFDRLLEEEEIDAVDICTPPWTHADLTVKAAVAGRHVLCEKPIATSLEDADRMIAAAKENGVNLMIGQTRRFDDRYLAIKNQIASGKVGRPVYVRRAERQFLPFPADAWYWNTSVGGGVILDIGVHASDLLRWMFDDEPVEVRAVAKAIGKAAQDAHSFDYAQITFVFSDGGIGFAETSWTHPGEYGAGQYGSVDVLGTDGMLEYSDRNANPMLSYNIDQGLALPRYFALMSSTEYAFRREIAAFVDSVVTNTPPSLDPSDARAAIAMALAAQEAAETGRLVRFEGSPTVGRGIVMEEPKS